MIKKYYFTFGFGQKFEKCYTVINANSKEKAIEIMYEFFGIEWAFVYDENQWILKNGKTQDEQYNLKQIFRSKKKIR